MADSESVDLKKLNVDPPSHSSNPQDEEKDATASRSTKASKDKKSRKRKMDCASDACDGQPAKKKAKRGWSGEEEVLFVAALSQFGRDWSAVAKHIGTGRKTPSIRSHAQVWFLKQLRDGHALPTKMLESGHGFTLSGEPLNKYSAVATRFFGSAQKVPAVDGVCSDEEAAQKHKRKPKKKKNEAEEKGEEAKDTTAKGKKKTKGNKKKAKKKKKKNKYYDSSSDEEVSYVFKADTAASTTAVRRSGRARRSTRDHSALHETDPFGLRTDIEVYDAFVGGSLCERVHAHKKGAMTQPFTVSYCTNSLVIADLHSHLCLEVEIMGLLGGTYDEETGSLRVVRCYPLKEEQQGSQSVAADPSDHFLATERMRSEDGLELVGWYHSHPCFENVPSNTDCHQHYIHKYEDEHKRPYIGLIVSSWSTPDTEHGTSHFRFFNSLKESGNNSGTDAVYTPYECRAHAMVDREVSDEGLCGEVQSLIERYSATQYDLYRTDCGEEWEEGKMSRFDKLIGSVRGHVMANSEQGDKDAEEEEEDKTGTEAFVDMVKTLFVKNEDTWWVTNKPSSLSTDVSDKENDNSLN